jgi:citrate lyase subunit beta/citryl-CoA lyase
LVIERVGSGIRRRTISRVGLDIHPFNLVFNFQLTPERAGLVKDWDRQTLRSALFVPGSDENKLGKVTRFGADVIVVDLEDAVADEQKQAARGITRAALPALVGDAVVVVRVNGIETGLLADDVAAVVCPELDAIMVPKVEDAETLAHADAAITAAETACGLEPGTIRLLVLIETPLGLTRCEDILAGAPARVHTSVFGAGDFSVALGVDLTPDATEILYARSRLVAATRAAGLAAPVDGPWLALKDVDGLEADSRRSRQLGFQGRVTVYPPQVETVLRAYSAMGEDEVARARRIVEAFEEAEARGVASLRVDGTFVDYPIYRLARERLQRYDAWRATTETTS